MAALTARLARHAARAAAPAIPAAASLSTAAAHAPLPPPVHPPPPSPLTILAAAAAAASTSTPAAGSGGAHSRAQLKTLATLRALLRHGNRHVAVLPPEGTPIPANTTADAAGLAAWRSSIVGLYRAQAANTSKAEVRALRGAAADVLATF